VLSGRRRGISCYSGLAAVLVLLGGCGGSGGDRPPEDRAARGVGGDASPVPVTRGAVRPIWAPGLGMVLLVPLDSADRSIIAFADSSADPADAFHERSTFVALARNGSVTTVDLTAVRERDGCLTGTVHRADAPSESAGRFVIGVLSDSVTLLPTDSTESLSRADSMALARDLIALASVIPGDTAQRFTGLPFRPLRLWRVRLPDGRGLAIGTLRRQIPQEAAPLEERTLVIATRSSGSAAWVAAHAERADGPEESVQTTELVAAISVGATPTIVLARDDGDGVAFQLLQLVGNEWRVGHTGPRQRC
jgi:hypothetical protein